MRIFGISVDEKKFQIGATVSALKLDKGGVLKKLTYFSNHEHDVHS